MNEETKYCKFCGKEKQIKDFVKSGFCVKNICKDCNNKKQKEVYKNSKNYYKLQQENKQLKQQLEQKDNIISASINKYIKEYEQKIDFEIDMGTQGEYKKIKCYEEFINKLNDLKNFLEKSDK